MAIWQAKDGSLFDDMDGTAIDMLPSGCVRLTAEQAQELLNPGQSLANAQLDKILSLSQSCEAEITGGFVSSALGSSALYGSQITDQNNLLSALAASQGKTDAYTAFLWCRVGSVWMFKAHSPVQIQQVNSDWVVCRTAIQQKYADAVDKVQSAASVSDVQSINLV